MRVRPSWGEAKWRTIDRIILALRPGMTPGKLEQFQAGNAPLAAVPMRTRSILPSTWGRIAAG
eukprot:4488023-Alexandrium_andersonii.AAC.1